MTTVLDPAVGGALAAPDRTAPHRVFAVLWCLAGLVHQFSFPGWRWDHWLGWLSTALAAASLARPASMRLFLAYVAVDLAALARASPRLPNHILVTALVDAAILASFAGAAARGLRGQDLVRRAGSDCAAAARLVTLVLYGYAVFHKLNTSHLDPAVSCSAMMYRDLAAALPFLPDGGGASVAAIGLVIAAEAAIPALLVVRRTAVVGVVAGMAFHLLLGAHPARGVYSFSATMIALLWLFVPEERALRFRAPRGWRPTVAALGFLVAAGYVAVQIARTRGAYDVRVHERNLGAGQALWAVLALATLATLAVELRRTRGAPPAARGALVPAARWLLAIPILAFANGLCPYLGLKTESSFAMFSNLATERGRTNHLLVPASVQVTPWLRDTVEVVWCSRPDVQRLAADGYAFPFMYLRLLRTRQPEGLVVTFVRDGRQITFDAARPETHAVLPMTSSLVSKLCQFRPVDTSPRVRCRH